MKKLLLLTGIIFAFGTSSFAQVELSAYTGYQFGSSMNGYSGKVKLDGAQDYGGFLAFEVRPDLQIELGYMYSATQGHVERYGLPNISLGDINVSYYQIGGIAPKPVSSNVDIFGSFTLGATYFDFQEETVDDTDGTAYRLEDNTSFSITLGGGAKIWLGDAKKIGIRLQGRFLMPINWGGITVGTGGAGATFGSAMFSGDLLGGLILRLGDN